MNIEFIKNKLAERGMELDSQDTMFLERELQKIESETYDVEFPELQYKEIVPVVVTNEPYAKSIYYKQATKTGVARIISDYADDLPNVSKFVKEFSRPVKAIGDAYVYSWEEVEAAAKNGVNLSSDLAIIARETIEQKIDDIALLGDDENGIEGFFDLSNVQSYTVPADGTAGSAFWSAKTNLQIIRDVAGLINKAASGTKGVESGVNTVLLPLDRYATLATTPMSADNGNTILQFLKNSFPQVTFMPAYKLSGMLGTPATYGERMIAYNRNPRKVKMNMTSPFRQMPPQAKNLSFSVPCVAKVAGVVSPYPMSIVYGDGI